MAQVESVVIRFYCTDTQQFKTHASTLQLIMLGLVGPLQDMVVQLAVINGDVCAAFVQLQQRAKEATMSDYHNDASGVALQGLLEGGNACL